MQKHQDNTIPTGNWVWVFGSNLNTYNGAGAAAIAVSHFDRPQYEVAKPYVSYYNAASGLKSYGIPTKDAFLKPLSLKQIQEHIEQFIEFVHLHSELNFFITKVGCGYAGYQDFQIAPMFKALVQNSNVSVASSWYLYLVKENSKPLYRL